MNESQTGLKSSYHLHAVYHNKSAHLGAWSGLLCYLSPNKFATSMSETFLPHAHPLQTYRALTHSALCRDSHEQFIGRLLQQFHCSHKACPTGQQIQKFNCSLMQPLSADLAPSFHCQSYASNSWPAFSITTTGSLMWNSLLIHLCDPSHSNVSFG